MASSMEDATFCRSVSHETMEPSANEAVSVGVDGICDGSYVGIRSFGSDVIYWLVVIVVVVIVISVVVAIGVSISMLMST